MIFPLNTVVRVVDVPTTVISVVLIPVQLGSSVYPLDFKNFRLTSGV